MKKVLNPTILLLSIVFSGCFTGSIKIPGFVIEENQNQKWGIDSIPVDLVTIDEISIRGNIPFGDLLINGKTLFAGDLAGRIYAISLTDREQIGYFEIKNSQNPFQPAFYDTGLITLNLPKDKNESHLVFYDLINGKVTGKLVAGPGRDKVALFSRRSHDGRHRPADRAATPNSPAWCSPQRPGQPNRRIDIAVRQARPEGRLPRSGAHTRPSVPFSS
ncbi:MAG: hypothetical protein IAE91_04615 [Ignavibacteriaceae bacterium]|nr:hypothetical protein [Ignavibacteriaceae bacterium]